MDVLEAIAACGFEAVGECPASALEVRAEVRDMCTADKCRSFGKSWACPPGCGDIDSYQQMIDGKTTCYVAQTVRDLEDEFDVETMLEASETNRRRFEELHEKLARCAPDARVLASGTCTICKTCTYPDAPCRFPARRLVSMEAAGLVVGDVCISAGVPYNHGKNTIAYTGCVLV